MDKYFDTTIVDPYRWLEDDYSFQTKSWVDKQNVITDRYLRKIGFRRKIEKKIEKHLGLPFNGYPFFKKEESTTFTKMMDCKTNLYYMLKIV